MNGTPALVVTSLGEDSDGAAVAAAIAIAAVRSRSGGDPERDRGAVLADLAAGRPRRPGLLASGAARALEEQLSTVGDLRPAPRGHVCHLTLAGQGPEGESGGAGTPAAALIGPVLEASGGSVVAIHAPPALFLPAIELAGAWRPVVAVVVAGADRRDPRLPLAVAEARSTGIPIKVWTRPPATIPARRALAGIDPGGATGRRAERHARILLAAGGGPSPRSAAEAGQAMPAVLGFAIVVVAVGIALAALGGALTGKARAQRAADLAAISAARSMRDDFGRLFVPARRADGGPNPGHLDRSEYLARARAAARQAARRNGAGPARIAVRFPDRESFAPLRVRVRLLARVEGGGPDSETPVEAEAAAEPGAAAGGEPAPLATGGGYSGPLEYRQGEGMRPDVAAAFDRMARGASRAGIGLVISSGFRSDAEQARLFAQNPDPHWVAPPGRSLHRCATELDLGPPSAYPWLAANAPRFGFVKRYSWEPWHFGFDAGPPPCSRAGERPERPGRGPGDGRLAASGGLPGFVPAAYRRPLLTAASRHGAPAALLAAQIMAESNFNPAAVSAAGARGISQFMPATAAAYGLRDPFDPVASIDAQARMMSELLDRFGSVRLALAAYNAGPGVVAACNCIPPYAETQAYVARILGLLGGAGALTAPIPTLDVRLVS